MIKLFMVDVIKIPKGVKTLDNIKNSIEKAFGIKLSNGEAFKVLCWKASFSQVKITEKKLLEILHGK